MLVVAGCQLKSAKKEIIIIKIWLLLNQSSLGVDQINLFSYSVNKNTAGGLCSIFRCICVYAMNKVIVLWKNCCNLMSKEEKVTEGGGNFVDNYAAC